MPGERTKYFEGYSPTIYRDTRGKRTIGYGFNIDDPYVKDFLPEDVVEGRRPIMREEADAIFDVLYGKAKQDAVKFTGEETYNKLTPEVQEIVDDMSYNMGYPTLSQFTKFKSALQTGDTRKAAEEMRNSRWYEQVGDRSKSHYEKMKKHPKMDMSFLNPFHVGTAEAAEPPKEQYLHRQHIQKLWDSYPDNKARIEQLWQESEESAERDPSLLRVAKEGLEETAAMLQDLLTMPSRIFGLPHPPMVSKYAKETVPQAVGELSKPLISELLPTFSLANIKSVLSGKGFTEFQEVSPSAIDVAWYATLIGYPAFQNMVSRQQWNSMLNKLIQTARFKSTILENMPAIERYAASAGLRIDPRLSPDQKINLVVSQAQKSPTLTDVLLGLEKGKIKPKPPRPPITPTPPTQQAPKPAPQPLQAPKAPEAVPGVTPAPIVPPRPVSAPVAPTEKVPGIKEAKPKPPKKPPVKKEVIPGVTEAPREEVVPGIKEEQAVPGIAQRVAEQYTPAQIDVLTQIEKDIKGAAPGHKYVTRDEAGDVVKVGYEPSDFSYIPYWPEGWSGREIQPLITRVKQGRFLAPKQKEKIDFLVQNYQDWQRSVQPPSDLGNLKKALALLKDSPIAQSVMRKLGTNIGEIEVVIDKVGMQLPLDPDEQAIFNLVSQANMDTLEKEIATYERKISQISKDAQAARARDAGGFDEPAAKRALSHSEAHDKDEAVVEGVKGPSVRQLVDEGEIPLDKILGFIDRALLTKKTWLDTILKQNHIAFEDLKQDAFERLWDSKKAFKGDKPMDKWLASHIESVTKNLLQERSSPDNKRYTSAQITNYRKLVDKIKKEGRQPSIEEIAKRLPDQYGHPGVTLERAKYIEWMANTRMIEMEDAGIEPTVPFPIDEVDINTRVKDIVLSSPSMLEAQKKLKQELDLDFTVEELKDLEVQVKGGTLPDLATRILTDAVNKVLGRERDADIKYGFSKIIDVDESELEPGLVEKVKEAKDVFMKKFLDAFRSLETAQTYLYAYPDSKPISEGVIDANAEHLKNISDMERAYLAAKTVENPEVVARYLVNADRDNTKNLFALLRSAVKKGQITERDYQAYTKGLYHIRKFIRNSLIEDILNSRLGIRMRSRGLRYLTQYTRKDGKTMTRWLSGAQKDSLKERFGKVNILEEKELVSYRSVDPATGQYRTQKALVNDYAEAVALLDQKTKALIDQILPYENWISHSRRGGKFWVEIYENLAAGVKEEKIFSARVPTQAHAERMAEICKEKFPAARVEVKPHRDEFRFMPSFGTMADVQFFLNQNAIDPKSEAGQRIMNAYRAMSPIMSTLIHGQNLAGWRTDYPGIIDNMYGIAKAAATRRFRVRIQDLRGLMQNIQDDFRRKVAGKFLEALVASKGEAHPILNGLKAGGYFMLLANKPTYIVQNLTEPLWAFIAALDKAGHPFKMMRPLSDEYKGLIKKAEREGILRPFFMEQFTGRGLLARLGFLGQMSEHFSSKEVFKIGLALARDQGLHGEKAYRHAYQFLFNDGKPFYNQANAPNFTLGNRWGAFRDYGLMLMRWWMWWLNKLARGTMKKKLLMLLGAFLLSGSNFIPFGKKILKKTGLVEFRKQPRDLTFSERFLLGGLPAAALGISSRFLAPTIGPKGVEESAALFKNLSILSSRIKQADVAWRNYGLVGLAMVAPLAGLQYPIYGATVASKGYRRGGRVKYRPLTFREKMLLIEGLTPLEMEMKLSPRVK